VRRIVIDTNIYIDWLNWGRHEEVILQKDAVKYLSAIVWMELLAGAFRVPDKRLVQRMTAPFAKVDRVLAPSVRVYEDAGHVLQKLQKSRHYDLAKAHSLVGDVLIALSARSMGATVFTQNREDFMAIQQVRFFELTIVD